MRSDPAHVRRVSTVSVVAKCASLTGVSGVVVTGFPPSSSAPSYCPLADRSGCPLATRSLQGGGLRHLVRASVRIVRGIGGRILPYSCVTDCHGCPLAVLSGNRTFSRPLEIPGIRWSLPFRPLSFLFATIILSVSDVSVCCPPGGPPDRIIFHLISPFSSFPFFPFLTSHPRWVRSRRGWREAEIRRGRSRGWAKWVVGEEEGCVRGVLRDEGERG